MANLSNINNKFIVTDDAQGNVLVNSTANLTTYNGISLYGANPSLAIKTSSGSGWIWTQYVNSSGTNNFSMGVNQSIPYWGVGAGAGMGGGTMDLVVDSTGNVGIGTYSPVTTLHVNSNATPSISQFQVTSNLLGGVSILNYSADNSGIFFDANFTGGGWKSLDAGSNFGIYKLSDKLKLVYNSGIGIGSGITWFDGIVMDASGDVGIGTSPGSNRLHVKGNVVGGNITTRFEPLSNNAQSTFFLSSTGSGDGGYYYNSNNNTAGLFSYGDYTFNVGTANISGAIGDPRMVIQQGGNVGIGETVPESKLEISDTSVGTDPLSLDSNFLMLTNKDLNTGGEVWGIGFNARSGVTNYLGAFIQAYGYFQTNGNTGLIFGTRAAVAGATATERMRIDSSGNVGIGTTSPGAKLEIGTSGGTAKPDALRISNASDYTYYWDIWRDNTTGYLNFGSATGGSLTTQVTIKDVTGNVGIGTASPDYQLDVENSSHAVIRIHAGVNSSASLRLKNDAQEWDLNTQTNDTFAIYNQTNASQPFSILPGGNVGIGTSSPVAKLDVDGSAKIKTRELSWYRCGPITSTDAYRHIKTTLAGNGMHIMGGIIVTGYSYSSNGYGEGSCMFHNSANTIYNLNVTNRGSWATFVQAPYLSSDNYIVFVLRHNTYAQPILDLYQYYTPYPWRNISVSAETTSNSTTGVY